MYDPDDFGGSPRALRKFDTGNPHYDTYYGYRDPCHVGVLVGLMNSRDDRQAEAAADTLREIVRGEQALPLRTIFRILFEAHRVLAVPELDRTVKEACNGLVRAIFKRYEVIGESPEIAAQSEEAQDLSILQGSGMALLRDIATSTQEPTAEAAELPCVIYPTRDVNLVYCAGPLFNDAERETMAQMAAALEADGFRTFLPHRDGLEFARIEPCLEARGHSAEKAKFWLLRAIDALDCYQVVVRCGSLVFNASGRVPDEGAVAEASMGYLMGKPLVYFKFGDSRSLIAGEDNPLVFGRGNFNAVQGINDLPQALRERIQELKSDPNYAVPCAEHVWKNLDDGRKIWETVEEINREGLVDPHRRAERMCLVLEELFGERA